MKSCFEYEEIFIFEVTIINWSRVAEFARKAAFVFFLDLDPKLEITHWPIILHFYKPHMHEELLQAWLCSVQLFHEIGHHWEQQDEQPIRNEVRAALNLAHLLLLVAIPLAVMQVVILKIVFLVLVAFYESKIWLEINIFITMKFLGFFPWEIQFLFRDYRSMNDL